MENDVRREKFLREAVVEVHGKLYHWIDALALWLENRLRERKKDSYVFNGGLSVSGLQHVGRLRGEIVIPDIVANILEEKGFKIKRMLTLYTQDAWKGKPNQLKTFKDTESAKRFIGWPLVRVPDPKGCHSNWVEHFWSDFGPYIEEFTRGKVEVVTTTELYQGKLREFTMMILGKRDEVRKVVNKYRGRKPYPEGWIPFEAICGKCGRIDSTEAIALKGDKIEYRCRNCGYRGLASISDGKLNWRIEWVGVWWSLGVDFEPYGKDHATPGGSRDSANELAVMLGVKPPEGIPYEWVSLRTEAGETDMSSSSFVGFTPREWLEVAEPEVYRFLVLRTPPMRKLVLSLREIPNYYAWYYQAERIYYGLESTGRKELDILLKRSYELSYVRGQPPSEPPAQPPYTHLAILAQILPSDKLLDEALRRLQRTGHIPLKPREIDIERVKRMLPRAKNWAEKYAPENMRIRIVEKLSDNIIKRIEGFRKDLERLADELEKLREWKEDEIKEAMIRATRGLDAKRRREFYAALYTLFFGKSSGPRAAPLLSLLEKKFVINRLRLVE